MKNKNCKICNLPDDIQKNIINELKSGTPQKKIVDDLNKQGLDISYSGLNRHLQRHTDFKLIDYTLKRNKSPLKESEIKPLKNLEKTRLPEGALNALQDASKINIKKL